MNPHNLIDRTAEPPIDAWKCRYCSATGTLAELAAIECAYAYPPCDVCGQTPECARGCAGIAAALSGAYVVGAPSDIRHRIDSIGSS